MLTFFRMKDLEIENSYLMKELAEARVALSTIANEKHLALDLLRIASRELLNCQMDNMLLAKQVLIATSALRKKDLLHLEDVLIEIQAYDKPHKPYLMC